jgi:hypothetical protein
MGQEEEKARPTAASKWRRRERIGHPPGLAAANLTDPQSWNRYAYVRNSPLLLVDPLGLWCVWQDGTHDDDPASLDDDGDGGDTVGECLGNGGAWDPSDTITGCDSDWNCTTSTGQTIGGVCPPDADSCVAGPNSTVVVNGGDGGSGIGLPPPGCAFYYQSGSFIGIGCGNGGGTGSIRPQPAAQYSKSYTEFVSCQVGQDISNMDPEPNPLINPFYLVNAAPLIFAKRGNLPAAAISLVFAGYFDIKYVLTNRETCAQSVYGPGYH